MNPFPSRPPSSSSFSFVETLAHVAAPSRACDDVNYRSHAAACLDFQPVSRVRVHAGLPSHDGDDNESDGVEDGQEDQRRQQSPGCPQKKQKKRKKNNVGSSPRTASSPHVGISLLTSSFPEESILHGDSPPHQPPVPATRYDCGQHQQSDTGSSSRRVARGENDELSSSFHTPPSTVPDSQSAILTPGADIERNTTPDHNDIHNDGIIATNSNNNNDHAIQFPTVLDRSSQVLHHPETSTPAPAASTSTSKKRHRDEEAPDPHVYSPSSHSLQPPPPSSKPQPHHPIHPAAAAAAAAPWDPAPLLTDSRGHLLLPLQIHPPPPGPSSTATFTTHVTPTLRTLATRLRLERVFRPTMRTRKLRALERGFWIVSIRVRNDDNNNNTTDENGNDGEGEAADQADDIWPARFFARFWTYLSSVIGARGLAGWGVWCHCEETVGGSSAAHHPHPHPHPDHANDNAHSASATPSPPSYPVTIRVYTWGETAAHVYLLLYLASEKRIKRLRGVEWRDGKGEVVLRMR